LEPVVGVGLGVEMIIGRNQKRAGIPALMFPLLPSFAFGYWTASASASFLGTHQGNTWDFSANRIKKLSKVLYSFCHHIFASCILEKYSSPSQHVVAKAYFKRSLPDERRHEHLH
jgi:hypothetical protein